MPVIHEPGHTCHWCGQFVDGYGGELWVYEARFIEGQESAVTCKVYYPACEGCCDA